MRNDIKTNTGSMRCFQNISLKRYKTYYDERYRKEM